MKRDLVDVLYILHFGLTEMKSVQSRGRDRAYGCLLTFLKAYDKGSDWP